MIDAPTMEEVERLADVLQMSGEIEEELGAAVAADYFAAAAMLRTLARPAPSPDPGASGGLYGAHTPVTVVANATLAVAPPATLSLLGGGARHRDSGLSETGPG